MLKKNFLKERKDGEEMPRFLRHRLSANDHFGNLPVFFLDLIVCCRQRRELMFSSAPVPSEELRSHIDTFAPH